ncbi:hypothetical protein BS78_07G035900 [Paspalum vaginatum]|nr:hypothetical protein BS78_07G035900 [Paspalum vaginatum]
MDDKQQGSSVKQTVVQLVMYPGGGIGHVGPMTRLAELFLRRGYDVTIVLVEPPTKHSSGDSGAGLISRVAAANPSITFHVLPPIPPPDDLFTTSTTRQRHPYVVMLEFMRRYNDELERFLSSIPRRRLHSLVIDMFCTQTIDVAKKLRVPVYTFFASGAGFLAVLAQLPALLAGRRTGLKELGDTPLHFLGAPPMPASHLVRELLESPEEELCRTLFSIWKRNTDDTDGVLVNTFRSLERRALQALGDPRCVPGQVLPPVYSIGPLVAKAAPRSRSRMDGGGGEEEKGSQAQRPECECLALAWLDAQPERSVVFLCWGSKGSLSEEQIKEIAAGLEMSVQRFLWVVRTPSGADDAMRYLERHPEPDLDALLPEGFLERTTQQGLGLVLRSWAPQVDVLNHPAVGAFVTHCGWNSTLEAVAAGVPMLCWPLAAEQKMNKVFLVADDMGVGVELQGYDTGFVKAEEIAAKVRLVLQESEEGRKLRARAAELKKEAREALLEEGGSSHAAFLRFLSDAADNRLISL